MENCINELPSVSVVSNTSVSNNYKIYLCSSIESPENYLNHFNTLYTASAEDTVDVYINTDGGHISTALQFIDAIKGCSALVTAHLVGRAYSAGTMIFLACDAWRVAENSSFMVHHATTGSYGKVHEVESDWIHSKQWLNDIVKSTYKDFLTKKEISQVIKGEDLYMNPKELESKLINLAEKRSKEQVKILKKLGVKS